MTKTKGELISDNLLEVAKELLRHYEEDIASGLEDGTYDKEDNVETLAFIAKAEKTIKDFEEYQPAIYLYVEGGNIQGASATESLSFNLFDKDNLYGVDEEEEKKFIETFGTPDQWDEMIKQKTADNDIKFINYE